MLAATFWPHTARLVRGEATSLRERPFVADAQPYLGLAWLTLVFPGAALALLVLALNLAGDGLAEALGVRAQRPAARSVASRTSAASA